MRTVRVREPLTGNRGQSNRRSSRTARAGANVQPFNVSLAPGKTSTQRFPRAGGISQPVRLSCAFHGAMRAWIYVFDQPHFQLASADGRFRMTDVPAGEYRLEMVHPAGELRWSQPITVRSGELTEVDIRVSPDDKGTIAE